MGIRPYYEYSEPSRFRFRPALTPAVRGIIVITLACAALELVLWAAGREPTGSPTVGARQPRPSTWWEREIFLTPRRALNEGRLWQFFTYLLVQPPGGVFTLIGTMLVLYIFGPDLERHLGGKRFIGYYLVCGLGGGLLALAWYDRSVAGAWPAVLGVAVACALLWPNRPMQIIVPVRTKWVVLVLVAAPALIESATAASKGRLPHLPELGGPAVALLLYVLTGLTGQFQPGRADVESEPAEVEVDLRRVDEILKKVHERGVESLTRRERRILERASAELRRRSRDRP